MEVWNNQLLLSEGSWDNVGQAAETVRTQLVRRLIGQRSVPCEQGIAYWTAVPTSGASTALFYVQNGPFWVVSGLIKAYDKRNSPGDLRSMLTRLVEPHWHAVKSLGTKNSSFLPYIIGRYRALNAFWTHWAESICAERLAALKIERNKTAEQIGRLMCAQTESPVDFVADIASISLPEHVGATLHCASPAEALELLQRILNEQPKVVSSQIPGYFVRWWPFAALTLIGAWKLSGSWPLLVDWVQNSVVQTVQVFYKKWIIKPLLKIYKIIRHDPTQQVALVFKESLASDSISLERMVIEFAKDTNPSLSSSELENLRLRAASGDLSLVMAAYEKQIGSPLTSLVTGKLIRTLLIQVQKGKVDLEVALKGIDNLLQSQQLVFGLVAAVPAIGVLWWLLRISGKLLFSQVYGTEAAKAKSERSEVVAALSNLDVVVQQSAQELRYIDVGLIAVHIAMVRRALQSNTLGSQQLNKVLDRLQTHAVQHNSAAVLADLDRAYMRYQLN